MTSPGAKAPRSIQNTPPVFQTPLGIQNTPFPVLKTRAPRDGGLPGLVRKNIPEAQWTFVESGSTSSGIPDAEFCFDDGAQGWLELKQTSGWTPVIRPEQVAWLLRRARLDGRCFVLVRRTSEPADVMAGVRFPKNKAVDELWLVRGADAGVLKAGGLKAVKLVFFSPGGPKAWDWRGLARALRG